MIRLSDLTKSQREAFLNYMAMHHDGGDRETLRHNGATIECCMTVSTLEELASADLNSAMTMEGTGGGDDGSGRPGGAKAAFEGIMQSAVDRRQAEVALGRRLARREPPSTSLAAARAAEDQSRQLEVSPFPLATLKRFIEDFYDFRFATLVNHRAAGLTHPVVDDVSVHLFGYLTKEYGVESIVKRHSVNLLKAVRHYRPFDLDVQVFGALLSSACYDTVDIDFFLRCRDRLSVYAKWHDVPATSSPVGEPSRKRYIVVRNIPAITTKVISELAALDPLTRTLVPTLLPRVRFAMSRWFNGRGEFPELVSDPNFYTYPFASTNPYVSHLPATGRQREGAFGMPDLSHLTDAPDDTQRFRILGEEPGPLRRPTVVELGQLLVLYLLNYKHERCERGFDVRDALLSLTTPSAVDAPMKNEQVALQVFPRPAGITASVAATRRRSPVSSRRATTPTQRLAAHTPRRAHVMADRLISSVYSPTIASATKQYLRGDGSPLFQSGPSTQAAIHALTEAPPSPVMMPSLSKPVGVAIIEGPQGFDAYRALSAIVSSPERNKSGRNLLVPPRPVEVDEAEGPLSVARADSIAAAKGDPPAPSTPTLIARGLPPEGFSVPSHAPDPSVAPLTAMFQLDLPGATFVSDS